MPTTATAQNTGVVETAITFIQDGGFFMYPILVVLALGLALSLERIIYLQATKAKNQKTWSSISSCWNPRMVMATRIEAIPQLKPIVRDVATRWPCGSNCWA